MATAYRGPEFLDAVCRCQCCDRTLHWACLVWNTKQMQASCLVCGVTAKFDAKQARTYNSGGPVITVGEVKDDWHGAVVKLDRARSLRPPRCACRS